MHPQSVSLRGMPPKAPRTQVLERYKVEREDGAPLFADCIAPGEPVQERRKRHLEGRVGAQTPLV